MRSGGRREQEAQRRLLAGRSGSTPPVNSLLGAGGQARFCRPRASGSRAALSSFESRTPTDVYLEGFTSPVAGGKGPEVRKPLKPRASGEATGTTFKGA